MGHADGPRQHHALSLDTKSRRLRLSIARCRPAESDSNAYTDGDCYSYLNSNGYSHTDAAAYSNTETCSHATGPTHSPPETVGGAFARDHRSRLQPFGLCGGLGRWFASPRAAKSQN